MQAGCREVGGKSKKMPFLIGNIFFIFIVIIDIRNFIFKCINVLLICVLI
jgi:hypothetical protein